MKYIPLFLLVPVLVFATTFKGVALDRLSVGDPDRILIVGDSTASSYACTDPWRKRLSDSLGNRYFVGEWGRTEGTASGVMEHENFVNDLGYSYDGVGKSGHSTWPGTNAPYAWGETRSALYRVEWRGALERYFKKPIRSKDSIIMLIGVNDVVAIDTPPSNVIDNGTNPFVDHVNSWSTDINVFIMSILPYANDNATKQARLQLRVDAMNEAYSDYVTASERGKIYYINVHDELLPCWGSGEAGECNEDSLHPNDIGCSIISNKVLLDLNGLGLGS